MFSSGERGFGGEAVESGWKEGSYFALPGYFFIM